MNLTIQPRLLQTALLAYLTPILPIPVRGSDDPSPVALPTLLIHIGQIEEEWEDTGIWRVTIAMQLHTQADDEDQDTAAERLGLILDAMADADAVEAAIEEDFALSALIHKGLTLTHKENQLIHANRYELLLSANIPVP